MCQMGYKNMLACGTRNNNNRLASAIPFKAFFISFPFFSPFSLRFFLVAPKDGEETEHGAMLNNLA